MSDINEKLNLIIDARDDMKTALEGKGQVVTKDIRTYAEAIANIEEGSGDVKLFDTVEEMQSDPEASEGDLAVVYREEIQPVTEDSEFDSCTFPSTVVLDEAFSGNINGSFRAVDQSVMFDGMVDMSSSNFRFNGWSEGGSINVQYTSSDGITYTRTDGGEELQEFGTTIKWADYGDPFNIVIGAFMKVNGTYFGGMYKYTLNNADNTKVRFVPASNCEIDISNRKIIADTTSNYTDVDKDVLIEILNNFAIEKSVGEVTRANVLYRTFFYLRSDNNIGIVYNVVGSGDNAFVQVLFNVDNSIKGICCNTLPLVGADYSTTTVEEYLVNINNKTYEKVNTSSNRSTINVDGVSRYLYYMPIENISVNSILIKAGSWDEYEIFDLEAINSCTIQTTDTDGYENLNVTYKLDRLYNSYTIAKSQLSALQTNELLPDKMAYGSSGIITGDSSIYSNLDASEMYENYYKLLYNSNKNTYYGIKQNYYRLGRNNHTLEKSNIKYYAPSNNIYDVKTNNGIICIPSSEITLYDSLRLYSPNRQYYYVRNSYNGTIKSYNSSDVEVSSFSNVLAIVVDNVEGLYFMDNNQNTSTESTNIYKIDLDTNTKSTVATIPAIPSGYTNSYQYSYIYERVDNYVFFRKCGTSNGRFLNRVYMLDLQNNSLTLVADIEKTASTTSAAIMLDSENNKIFLILIYSLTSTYGQAGDYTEIYELQTSSTIKSFSLVTTINKPIANLISQGLKYCTAYEYDTGKYVYSGDNLMGIMDLNNSTQELLNGIRWYKNNVYEPYSGISYYTRNNLGSNLIYSGNKLYYLANPDLYISNVSIETVDNKKFVRFDGQDIITYNPIQSIAVCNYPINPDGSFTSYSMNDILLSKPRIMPSKYYEKYGSPLTGYLINDTTIQINESPIIPSSGNTLNISGRVYSKIDKPSDSENVIIGIDTSISNGDTLPSIILLREPRN